MVTVFDNWWMWAGFFAFVVVAILADLFLLKSQGAHRVKVREAAIWTIFWVAISLSFNGLLYYYLLVTHDADIASVKATEFLTGYLIEKALSVDNIFAFYLVFSLFSVPPHYQKRALIIGIIGSIVLRTVMILIGGWLISQFSWILYVFGAFLVYTGFGMLRHKGDDGMENNKAINWLKKHIRCTNELDGEKFFILKNGVRFATPVFLAVATIGLIDIVFAVDSIPAIFAITQDPFIVLTSNIFAVLGLRALYFLLADMVERFHYLPTGLAIILMFIGTKMLIVDFYHVPVSLSLSIVALILIASIVISQIAIKKK